MSNIGTLSSIWLLVFFTIIYGFVPHPSVRLGGQAGDSKSCRIALIPSTYLFSSANRYNTH